MKSNKISLSLLLISLFFSLVSCKKDSEKKVQGPDEIKYEVTLQNASTWNGSYVNEYGQAIPVNDAPSGWSFSFINNFNLIAPTIVAYPDGINVNADCFMIIKINGNIVASGKTSISPMVQFLYP